MKKLLTTTLFLFTILSFSFSQRSDERMEKVESMKIAFISSKLDLSTDEAQNFWPIYNEMNEEMKAISGSSRLDRKEFQDLSDSDADKLLESMINDEQKKLEIKKSYARKMSKVIGAKKVLKLFKSDRQFKQKVLNNMKERGERGKHGDRQRNSGEK